MYVNDRMRLYEKLLVALIILNLVGGGILAVKALSHKEYSCYGWDCGYRSDPDMIGFLMAGFLTAISVFLPILLLDLIGYIESVNGEVHHLQMRVIQMEKETGTFPPAAAPVAQPASPRPKPTGSLSKRLGRL